MERTLEHVNDALAQDSKSHIWNHLMEDHPDNVTTPEEAFSFKPLNYHNFSLRRQLEEATMISMFKGHKILNSKEEYSRCVIPTLAVIGRKGRVLNLDSPKKKEDKRYDEKKIEVLVDLKRKILEHAQ